MLEKLDLTYFRQHEALTVTFTEGLNCIRAPNEGGKTTLLEALGYALFGTPALRNKFEDVVTWGQKPSQLKVVARYDGYTFERSKGGATVYNDTAIVATGQTEVSAFATKLLGCDAKIAGNLMLAGQGGLRGILEAGPTAAANLIEDLGEFDLFDRILAAAETKLPLGSAAIQTDRIARLKVQLDDIHIVQDPRPVWDARRTALDKDKAKVEDMIKDHVAARTALDDAAKEEHRLELQAIKAKGTAETLARVKQRISTLEADRAKIFPTAQLRTESTEALSQQIAGAGEAEKVRALHGRFVGTLLQHASWFEQEPVDREEQNKRTADLTSGIAERTASGRDHREQVKVLAERMVSSSTCGFCGQDVSQFPEVATKNDKLAADIKSHEVAAEKLKAECEGLRKELLRLVALIEADAAVGKDFTEFANVVDVDETHIPAKYSWRGEAPGAVPVSVEDLKAKLAEIEASNNTIISAKAKHEALVEGCAAAARELVEVEAELKLYPADVEHQLELCRERKVKAQELENKLSGSLTLTRANLQRIEQQLEADIAEWTRLSTLADDLRRQIADTEKEVETLAFNNLLVKKVRAARPVIGNKLWTMVLASVSTILGKMRGEQSIVAKGKDGFTVNGNAATSLSGSALDLLGLAIRCALIKTFIPGANFMMLDEPSAACDQDRTNAMLGYIASSGFGQVLLVTHNEQSESFAHNLIQL